MGVSWIQDYRFSWPAKDRVLGLLNRKLAERLAVGDGQAVASTL
jgi:hypothetical protein